MLSTIEVTGTAIRLVAVRERRITALEQWPVPPGADPLAVLASAPLPPGLGRVRVLIHHEDILLRTQTLPAGPQERLDRLVRFDAVSSLTEGSDPVTVAWHLVPLGEGDARVLVQLTKQRLVDRVRQALAPSGARLAGLGHPALGLVEALRASEPEHHGAACLIDIGGHHLHFALIKDGQPVLLRSAAPGADDLVARIADRRGLARDDAARLVERIGKGSPEDLHDLIAGLAGTIASHVGAAVRFARSQYRIEGFEPATVHLAGAGAQAYGLAEALRARLGVPVRLLNPFVGQLPTLDTALLDRLAGLPSPWAAAIGGCGGEQLALDALVDERRERDHRFRTSGVLRLAAAAAVVLLGVAVAVTELRLGEARDELADLQSRAPRAEAATKAANAARAAKEAARARLAWLDGERRAGRVAPELLAAVAGLQDPATCPVVLTALRVERRPGEISAEMEGSAQAAGRAGTDAVLRQFEQSLRATYPAIARIEQVPVPIERDRHPFRFRLTIPDQAR